MRHNIGAAMAAAGVPFWLDQALEHLVIFGLGLEKDLEALLLLGAYLG